MNEEILNTIYSASLEFGENFHKSILEIVEELYPYISDEEKTSTANYIEQTRDSIERYFCNQYDCKNENLDSELRKQGEKWIKDNYPWLNSENVNRALSQGMYYAWRG